MRIIEDTPFSCRQNDGGATLSLPGAFPRAAPSHCLRGCSPFLGASLTLLFCRLSMRLQAPNEITAVLPRPHQGETSFLAGATRCCCLATRGDPIV